MSTARPPRLRVTDELGRVRTLDDGPDAFVPLAASAHGPVLLLGTGPTPATPASLVSSGRPLFWLDCPAFLAQMPPTWRVPAHWQRIAPADLPALALEAEIWQYRAAPKLFPSFWGPLLGALAAARLQTPSREQTIAQGPRGPEADPVVILPRTALMHRELVEAFAAHGLRVLTIDSEPAKAAAATLDILKNETVRLFLSLNFEGLDAGGDLFHLLRARHIPVAAWLVDNPWNLLSRLQQPWWRGVRLFVTDPTFVAPLQTCGATSVQPLPLAAWDMPVSSPAELAHLPGFPGLPTTPVSFVGHSSFPQRDRFFSGLTLPPALWAEALSRLDTDTPPDAHWWQARLHLPLWPGLQGRLAGLGAERAALERRTRFLQACLPLGLTVYGDAGWAERLHSPQHPPTLHPPVDYHTTLGGLYAHSRYNLNVTSLQLPGGLTQRHFDVWQAGGFLLTDRSAGLELFPPDLTAPISAARPADLPRLVARLENDPVLRRDLITAW